MRNTYTFILLLVLLVSCSFSLRLTKFSKAQNKNHMTEEPKINTSSTKNKENSKPDTLPELQISPRALVGNGKGRKSPSLY